MPVSQKNLPLLHRKEWQMMTPLPSVPAAAAFVCAADSGLFDDALYINGLTTAWLYSHAEDGFVAIPSGALAGTFQGGASAVRHPWSAAYTANGGTTNTVTVAAATHNIGPTAKGSTIEILTGSNAGASRRTVTNVDTGAVGGTGTITITFDGAALGSAMASGATFRLLTGRYFVLAAGTLAAGSLKAFDVATLSWSASLVITNLPATLATDGKLVLAYASTDIFGTGTATSGAASTLTNTGKAWTVNQWTNSQVRIISGTGAGQVRTIASNTATVLTTSVAWTTNPDGTSVYEITANEDYLYYIGNAAVTMYRYSISANTWTVMAPTTARGGAPGSGMTANCIGTSGEASWALETNIQDGRYIYSARGGGSALIDRFDIAGGTAGAGAWLALPAVSASETFTTGSSGVAIGKYLYLRKDATNRFFKFDVTDNMLKALTTNLFTDTGLQIVGNKIWVKKYDAASGILWLYSVLNSQTILHRIMLF